MIFKPGKLAGPILVHRADVSDNRGFFSRTFCEEEFARQGLLTHYPQHSVSYNISAGTLRGMHYQLEPHDEAKIIRCTRGKIFDVVTDLRTGSATFCHWESFELDADAGQQLYVPRGFAHGFQTLIDDTEVFYLISTAYRPESSRGFRYDDKSVGIKWPLPVSAISLKDTQWPDFSSGNRW